LATAGGPGGAGQQQAPPDMNFWVGTEALARRQLTSFAVADTVEVPPAGMGGVILAVMRRQVVGGGSGGGWGGAPGETAPRVSWVLRQQHEWCRGKNFQESMRDIRRVLGQFVDPALAGAYTLGMDRRFDMKKVLEYEYEYFLHSSLLLQFLI
jgi:hypothetical protein